MHSAYWAGLFDGEGYVGAVKNSKGHAKRFFGRNGTPKEVQVRRHFLAGELKRLKRSYFEGAIVPLVATRHETISNEHRG